MTEILRPKSYKKLTHLSHLNFNRGVKISPAPFLIYGAVKGRDISSLFSTNF